MVFSLIASLPHCLTASSPPDSRSRTDTARYNRYNQSMNDYLLSVILGVVEGITEFLPVSSTAHLRIVEKAMNVDLGSEYWKMYSVVIQLGAILSVVVYFWRRII